MKSTSTLFALFLLLCAFFTSYLPSATADYVYDTDGEILRKDGAYFVLPVGGNGGGGVEFAATGNETCPLTVVQTPSEDSKGFMIWFSHPFKVDEIYEGFDLDIRFFYRSPCTPSTLSTTKWTLVKEEDVLAVKLTRTSPSIIPGSFDIKKANSGDSKAYKFAFCNLDNNKCGYIGIHTDDDGNRRLVMTDNDPLLVHFQNFKSASAGKVSTTGMHGPE